MDTYCHSDGQASSENKKTRQLFHNLNYLPRCTVPFELATYVINRMIMKYINILS